MSRRWWMVAQGCFLALAAMQVTDDFWDSMAFVLFLALAVEAERHLS